ncbi:glycosyltransferase [Lysinibacillus yapensis]|uniref:Glycosyltransferase n=1 Tax=Ureibacillus yapensis TaxID=2304605 RepID=A0A396SCH9_9BACL|nr:flagellar brake domain-containing protein [Lysinibacillus yapensis]RHW39330.1 glycosyltransferase [Lysinibacillus yapensis]
MQLKIGTALTLEPTYTERVEKFRCKVIEQDSHTLYIDYPINTQTNKTAFLVDGSQFRATFITENNISYAFNTEVVGRKMGNIPMIKLYCPPEEEFIKIQRREFVRVNTAADVAVKIRNNFHQFVTEDISAGGMALHLKNEPPFKEGDEVELTIVLPYINGDIRYVQTSAKIVRIFEKNQQKLASIQFLDTAQVDKQLIVRFCFERQLMVRKIQDAHSIV